ncbi:MAG: hypothetical protein ACW98D_17155 [Promethearchaeota archaeon]|jgi:hypothetical protein
MVDIILAILVTFLFCLMIIFQFLLVLGLPLGHLAYGGKYDHERLPNNLRIMSAIAIGIFAFSIIIILERVKLINLFNNPMVSLIALWILAAYFTLNVLMNLMSKSKWEKRVMTPIAAIVAICCYIVAIIA